MLVGAYINKFMGRSQPYSLAYMYSACRLFEASGRNVWLKSSRACDTYLICVSCGDPFKETNYAPDEEYYLGSVCFEPIFPQTWDEDCVNDGGPIA